MSIKRVKGKPQNGGVGDRKNRGEKLPMPTALWQMRPCVSIKLNSSRGAKRVLPFPQAFGTNKKFDGAVLTPFESDCGKRPRRLGGCGEALAFASLLERRGSLFALPDRIPSVGRSATATPFFTRPQWKHGAEWIPLQHRSRKSKPRLKFTTARFPNMRASVSNMDIRTVGCATRWFCGKRSSVISSTARRSSSTNLSRLDKQNGDKPHA